MNFFKSKTETSETTELLKKIADIVELQNKRMTAMEEQINFLQDAFIVHAKIVAQHKVLILELVKQVGISMEGLVEYSKNQKELEESSSKL